MPFTMRAAWVYAGLFVLGFLDLSLRFFWLEPDLASCNPGIFLGIRLPEVIILCLGVLLIGYLAWHMHTSPEERAKGALCMMLVGGLVNLIDRWTHGCVMDYWTWPGVWGGIFPNFNLADMLLLLGLIGLGWAYRNRL